MLYTDDVPEQWERARELFAQLTAAVAEERYDDDYLRALIELQQLLPTAADGHIFYALYALAHGAVSVALAEAQAAYAERRVNPAMWRVLQTCYERQGDACHALFFAGLSCALYDVPVEVPLPRAELDRALAILSLSLHRNGLAPVTDAYLTMTEQGLQRSWGSYVGEFLPGYRASNGVTQLWVGAYNENECNNGKGVLLQAVKHCEPVLRCDGADLVTELVPARRVTQPVQIKIPPGETYALPLAVEQPSQYVTFTEQGRPPQTMALGQSAFRFYRLGQDTRIESAQPLIGYGIDRVITRFDDGTSEGRAQAFAEALALLAPIKDSVLSCD